MSKDAQFATNIGFIGLGVMGKQMAKNLLGAGHGLVVFDLNPAPVEELCSLGARAAASAMAVARQVNPGVSKPDPLSPPG